MHRAVARFTDGNLRSFAAWWAATILLGSVFLVGTALEWHDLYWHAGLAPAATYSAQLTTPWWDLALHSPLEWRLMVLLLALVWRRQVTTGQRIALELTSWYWHFVLDGVWVVVFTVVYLVGR